VDVTHPADAEQPANRVAATEHVPGREGELAHWPTRLTSCVIRSTNGSR
jgi:hypothetical protein